MLKKIRALYTKKKKKPKRILVVPRGMESGKMRRLLKNVIESAGNVKH